MNKKAYLLILLALILIPIVAATIGEGVEEALYAIFGSQDDLVYIKAGIWVVLFFIVFKSAERIFPYNRGAAMVIALVISITGARFMPDEYLEYAGGWYAIILGVVLLMIPFFMGSVIGDMLRWGKTGKTFLIILFYALAGYAIMKYDMSLQTGALSTLGVAIGWMSNNRIIVLVIIIILCIIFLWQGRSGGYTIPQGGGGGGGGERPSFWGGLGRGAMGGLAVGGKGLAGWIARRRATAKMRWAIQEAHRRKAAGMAPAPQQTGPTEAQRMAWRKQRLEKIRGQLQNMPSDKSIAPGGALRNKYIFGRLRAMVLAKKVGEQMPKTSVLLKENYKKRKKYLQP